MDITRNYLMRKFRDYYIRIDLSPPRDFERREWAFVPLEHFPEFVMRRHIAISSELDLKAHVIENVPAHVYYSTAYYEDPSAEMDKKGWLGADLIFDIDADHMPRPSLKAAKLEVLKLIKILTDDFGVREKDIEIVFSGRRGYHVHVYDDRFRELGSAERREIVDYLTLTGLKGGKQMERIRNCAEKLRSKYGSKAFEICSSKLRVHIDPPVTADIKRLIRLPNSLHGKTGLRVTPVPIDRLEDFDPSIDAVVFGEERVKVRLLRKVKVRMMGCKYELEPGRANVPEYLAIYLICRGVALYGH